MAGKKNGCYGENIQSMKKGIEYPNFDENKSDTLIVGDSFGSETKFQMMKQVII